ncbi:MAG TPA: molybdenum cofactor biosynthesis protein MoaE [Candidatus Acidoferrales bacterium]|jgi:molybdopterin synthase catalytic subunit|nr:molybdenum cofactor biosynthesis protein MoaE [Candidatus Acidoferrales bacterium]
MRVRVLFFGQLKEIVGRDEEYAELGDGARLQDLFDSYGRRYPKLAGFRLSVVASINQSLADWGSPLAMGDEVAFLPPVSGGAGTAAQEKSEAIVELVRERIQTEEISARLKAPEDGAIVVFEGIVRNHSQGRRTLYLDYEAYEAMALKEMKAIASAMRSQFGIDGVGIIHRLGRLQIGEASVLVAVTSAHRAQAFQACRYGIDTLKRTVPIWKKEYFEDGAVWAEGEIPPLPSNSNKMESMK